MTALRGLGTNFIHLLLNKFSIDRTLILFSLRAILAPSGEALGEIAR